MCYPGLVSSPLPTAAPGPDLASYDVLLVNSSAGKDSQAALDLVVCLARAQGIADRVVVVHCDLGRVEWEGTAALAEAQAAHYGVRFVKVTRAQGDLLQQVEQRGMWPSPQQRYCTSDHKRGQVDRVLTQLSAEVRAAHPERAARILNILGLRADESPTRAKKAPFAHDPRASNGRRTVDAWLPIHHWSATEVWATIRASGVPHHRAYDLGMPRLSCCFCIFAPRAALLLAGKHNRPLLDEYVRVEETIKHSFRMDGKRHLTLASIRDAVDAGEQPPAGSLQSWCM